VKKIGTKNVGPAEDVPDSQLHGEAYSNCTEPEIEPVEATKGELDAGVASQLVTLLPCGDEPGPNSPIPQVDAIMEAKKKDMFTFKSEYGVEDIDYSLIKILPYKVVPALVSRV
jgi:hypothetical protein